MNRDHKILTATVASGLMIGALVFALNRSETEICVSEDTISYAPYTYSHAIDLPSYDLSEDKISDYVDYQISELDKQLNEIIDEMDVWTNLDYSRVINQFTPATKPTFTPPIQHWLNTFYPTTTINPKICNNRVNEPGTLALIACALILLIKKENNKGKHHG